MKFKDYYKILGVKDNADIKEIKKAYRKLALKFHPDVSAQDNAEEQFKEVAEAYEILKDDAKRAEYDNIKKNGGKADPFGASSDWTSQSHADANQYSEADFSDFFNQAFGGSGGRSRSRSAYGNDSDLFKGQDIEMEVPLFLEDSAAGISKNIEFIMPVLSSGQVQQIKKSLKVKIPQGTKDGERIRLKGQGSPGSGDQLNGDLYLHIRLVPHPFFDVQGSNILLTVPLMPWEAALGTKLSVPTLYGKIQLNIPPNSRSGQKLRIKGKGLKDKLSQGDMFAILNIDIPPTTSEESKTLWEQLSKAESYNPRKDWSEM
ncbi:DnaJ C-terminal domain-containing protein [Glaciecola sp. SC05]|uniref:DnaJ C-terminal domain-containing protein n=1 Tax=Glaciecola sp. SC05 TaxID=1987355 RepID=UPI0035293BFB